MIGFLGEKIKEFGRRLRDDESGVALAEAGLIFPLLMTMLLGTFDVGNAILANQKTIRASQVTADLITRDRAVSQTDIDESVEAGQLALQPFETESYGVDVVSIRFDEYAEPEIIWRETVNMSPKASVLNDVESLADENSGVVVVTSQYRFEPIFAGFVVDEFLMEEVAFARGRRSATVNRE